MSGYENRKGEFIEVSKEHLETAVELKRELQMESPSHRCSWAKHKKLMQKEGFYDSDNNEAYRLLIKNYQKKIGMLDSKNDYDYKAKSKKLQAIKDATGEMYYTKREIQIESRNLQKLKRELTLFGVVAEQVREAIINELDQEIPEWSYKLKRQKGKSKMIVLLSDWHIGAVIKNVYDNSYNYDIAKKRVQLYYEKIKEIANANNVTDIDVICLGDMTEHISMRNINQSFETEFPVSVQIVKAYQLIRDFIVNLTCDFNITYRGISGNHDRFNGKKDDNVDGDSTIYIINYMIKTFAEDKKMPRFEYQEVDDINYSTTLSFNGLSMKFVHGDNEKRSGVLASHSALDGVSYNLVGMGHVHHFGVLEVGLNRFEATFGSLMGINNYGVKGKFGSQASQGVVIIDEDCNIDIKRVGLQVL